MAGSAATARTTLPPVAWRCRPWPIHKPTGQPVQVRGPLDIGGRHARLRLRPRGRALHRHVTQLWPAERVLDEELFVGDAVARQHVHQAESEGRIGAGEWLQVQVGVRRRLRAHRVHHNHRAGASGSQ